MSVRIVILKQESFYEEPIGTKPKLVEDIIEFKFQNHILKSGKLSSVVQNFLVKYFKKVSFGKIDENEIYTIAVEHVDDY